MGSEFFAVLTYKLFVTVSQCILYGDFKKESSYEKAMSVLCFPKKIKWKDLEILPMWPYPNVSDVKR